MGFNTLLANQLRCPQGRLGWYVGHILRVINSTPNKCLLGMMDIRPGDRVLEIGFGTGHTIKKIVTRVPQGRVYGIDFSNTMLHYCSRTNSREIARGSVLLTCADFIALPFKIAVFDRILTINTLYFINNPLYAMKEIKRVLKENGQIGIYLTQVESLNRFAALKTNVFAKYTQESIVDAVRKAGFSSIRCTQISFRMGRRIDGMCITGTKQEST